MASKAGHFVFSALVFSLAVAPSLVGAPPVTITIDAAHPGPAAAPVWNYFGYDEPNYTYTENGRKLIRELAELSRPPVYLRTHNLFTTGDGSAALKWGSTNAYTEDSSGKPVYDWSITDKILDTYQNAGAKPIIEIGFTPKALSPHPDPYRHNFPQGSVFTGWSYPPNDNGKWSELVRRFATHCAERYGKSEAESWQWEVWNEPDIGYWHGTALEYDTLYDYTSAAIKHVLPKALVGGPATTGPASGKAAEFLRQFLIHCASGKNASTGKTGAPLDFISFHVKGHPEVVEGHVVMGLAHELRDAEAGFRIVRAAPQQFRELPIVLTEADPEGCAACSALTNPNNGYRNGTLYPAYTAVATKALQELARREHVHLQGALTWAFEFEGQPYFAGFRDLATNGVDKPVLNFFRMAGMMQGGPLPIQSTGAKLLDSLVSEGVHTNPDVDGLATRSDRTVAVLVWNYQDEDGAENPANIHLKTVGLPEGINRILVQQYRLDDLHSNAFTAWKNLGSPENPTPAQQASLEAAGQLQVFGSPEWVSGQHGSLEQEFSLPSQSLSLFLLTW